MTKMPPKPVHTDIVVILDMRRRGKTIRDIASITGVPKSVVHRIIKGGRACDAFTQDSGGKTND